LKNEFYECDECGCVCDNNTLREIVIIGGQQFDFCFDCYYRSSFFKYLKNKNKEPIIIWENMPINNGWDGKKIFRNKK
jgi:hypothetical protein